MDSNSEINFTPESNGTDQCDASKILQGKISPFPGNTTLTSYFQLQLRNGSIDPNQIGLIYKSNQYTYKEIDELTNTLAQKLLELISTSGKVNKNPDNDSVIGVCLQPNDKLVLILLAIMKAGSAYVPFDISFPEERIVQMAQSVRPILIISEDDLIISQKFDSLVAETCIIKISEVWNNLQSMNHQCDQESDGSIGIVLYTSGSSGTPKGVRLSHRTILNRLFWQWETFPYIENEQCCFKTALTFVDSVSEIFGPILKGLCLTVFGKEITSQPNILIEKLTEYQINRLVLVPSLLRAMIHILNLSENPGKDKLLSSLNLWICSGESLSKELLELFFQTFPKDKVICNFYGSTEIMGDVTFEVFENLNDVKQKADGNNIPIGKAVFNTTIYILNESLGPIDEGLVGEICISGLNLSSGYVGIKDSDKFVTNPFSKIEGFQRLFKSGDYGRILKIANGERTLFYDGRVDSQIKIRGFRVDLSEVEIAISTLTSYIEKVVVLCYHPGKEDQALVAYIIPKSSEISEDQIATGMKAKLKPYEMPVVKIIKEIPLLVNGKTDRQTLLKLYEAERNNMNIKFEKWDELNIQKDDLEKTKALIQIVSEVTGTLEYELIKNLSKSYYEVGGTSLNSIVVVGNLREKGFNISIGEFIGSQNLTELIEKIQPAYGTGTQNESIEKSFDNYFTEKLSDEHNGEVRALIAYSFSQKGDLEQFTHATFEEFYIFIGSIWKTLIEKGFSYIVRRKSDKKLVAASLVFDVYDEPEEYDASPGIATVFQFLEFVESRERNKLPKGKGKMLHGFMMGTHKSVSDSENILLISYMEEELIRIAREHKFIGILTTNTNPLTIQIGETVNGYETLSEVKINDYVDQNGGRPFRLAPDSQVATCCWKTV